MNCAIGARFGGFADDVSNRCRVIHAVLFVEIASICSLEKYAILGFGVEAHRRMGIKNIQPLWLVLDEKSHDSFRLAMSRCSKDSARLNSGELFLSASSVFEISSKEFKPRTSVSK